MTTGPTYVPLSRGIREHLSRLSGNAVKLYIDLLATAGFSGANKGQVAASFGELASELKMHRDTVHKAACELRPYYLDWKPARNQHDVTIFTIQRYKSVEDFAYGGKTASTRTAAEQQPNSTACNSHTGGDLPAPNKPEKPKKANQAWEAIGIHATFNRDFNKFWESSFENRNGYTLSRTMRECANSWEEHGGKVPGPFYAAKAKVVTQEHATSEEARNAEASQIPTPADCRPTER
jgi:hypothetical protein